MFRYFILVNKYWFLFLWKELPVIFSRVLSIINGLIGLKSLNFHTDNRPFTFVISTGASAQKMYVTHLYSLIS